VTRWTSEELSQIRAILSYFYVGQDPWAKSKLHTGKTLSDVHYDQVFTVSENDVIAYVRQYGWDRRVVCPIESLPDNPEKVSWDWRFFVLPEREGKWTCGRRMSIERRASPYEQWQFPSEEEMVRFIVHDLVEEQRRLWGPRPVV
jgi:hypothetical protein